jgi:chromosome segregation ATPase
LTDALERATTAERQIEQLQQQLNSVQVSSSINPAEVQALREQLIETQRNLEAANADGGSKSAADAAQIGALQTEINNNRTMMNSAETTFAAVKKERDDALTRLHTSNGAGDHNTLKNELAQARNQVATRKLGIRWLLSSNSSLHKVPQPKKPWKTGSRKVGVTVRISRRI